MISITWLGEDTETEAGPSFVIWNGVKFPKGEAVQVADAYMVAGARDNRFFRVDEEERKRGQAQEAEIEKQETEKQEEAFDYSKAENKSGYSPKKQKRKKPKPSPTDGHDPTNA